MPSWASSCARFLRGKVWGNDAGVMQSPSQRKTEGFPWLGHHGHNGFSPLTCPSAQADQDLCCLFSQGSLMHLRELPSHFRSQWNRQPPYLWASLRMSYHLPVCLSYYFTRLSDLAKNKCDGLQNWQKLPPPPPGGGVWFSIPECGLVGQVTCFGQDIG